MQNGQKLSQLFLRPLTKFGGKVRKILLNSTFQSRPNFVSFCLFHNQNLSLCTNISVTLLLYETREITESCSDPFDGLGVEVDDAKHDETLEAVDDVTDHRKLRKG
jgi:hypothetical protein